MDDGALATLRAYLSGTERKRKMLEAVQVLAKELKSSEPAVQDIIKRQPDSTVQLDGRTLVYTETPSPCGWKAPVITEGYVRFLQNLPLRRDVTTDEGRAFADSLIQLRKTSMDTSRLRTKVRVK